MASFEPVASRIRSGSKNPSATFCPMHFEPMNLTPRRKEPLVSVGQETVWAGHSREDKHP